MRVRPLADGDDLWPLKAAFERELGAAGDEEKRATYEDKLDADYRDSYEAWVAGCVEREPGCIQVADPGGTADLAGYAFVLPEDFAHVWDAAVLNELYLRPAHRGTGVGDDLMEAATAHACGQDLPLDRIVLDVDRENERARAFYERHGFAHWGEMVARSL